MLNFTKLDRINPNKRDIVDRIKDFDEVYDIFHTLKAREQSSRCIGCGDPYCHTKCPLHNIIPAWLKQTANKNLQLAFDISNETSPFPEILGRICPHDVLCEGDCTLNDTHGAITIGSIETHISEKGFEQGLKPKFNINNKKLNKKVAIIGSGPAGISVATYLLRGGVDVEMFERYSRAGGLLTYGIPGLKLDKNTIQRRIDFLVEAGMKLHLNCEIGKDKSFKSLEDEFDKIFIGIGATKGNKPNLKGDESSNIYLAMEFLVSIQKKIFKESDTYIEVKDKKVLVIGGGDTAMDCVRTAIREGAKDVKCLYRRDEKNMPGSKKEYINAKEEGVEFIFNVSPNSIIANDNKATALVLDKTKLTTADENGRQKVQIVKNSSFTQEADIIIFALGFSQELPQFLQDSNLKLDSYDGIQTNKNHKTSNNNIYSGGDSVRGASLAVHAAADGRDSAIAMIEDFKNI